jgi:putative methionine-R-sulfoxide reductase with GAF domain
VLPVLDQDGKLLAVLDVDSTEVGAFDTTDEDYLTAILKQHFSQGHLQQAYQS